MTEELDKDGHRLLCLLVERLPSANTERPEKMIGYKAAHELLGLMNIRGDWAESLKAQGLDNLAKWTKNTEKPAITGIIVNQTSHSPGRGYYTLFGRKDDDWSFWREQIADSKIFDWSPYLTAFEAPKAAVSETPKAVDIEAPADRVESTVFRVIRDTVLSRRIKALHNFECQICGTTMKLPNGGRYAEAHHIKPLGTPHNGPDVAENIICLCPNHHAELDYGVRRLDRASIKLNSNHQISDIYILYHNSKVLNNRSDRNSA